MTLVYLLPLLIALLVGWLLLRYMRERRRVRELRAKLQRRPARPKFKARDDSARSEMRAYEDATTVARTIKQREPAAVSRSVVRGADGTRSKL